MRPTMAPKPSFNSWVTAYGIKAVAALCGVTDRSVYNWISRKSRPNHEALLKIQSVAPHISLADICGTGGAQ